MKLFAGIETLFQSSQIIIAKFIGFTLTKLPAYEFCVYFESIKNP